MTLILSVLFRVSSTDTAASYKGFFMGNLHNSFEKKASKDSLRRSLYSLFPSMNSVC
jgi:hypothetical protein